MKGLDTFLTTEPDNGYQKWEDRVMSLIPQNFNLDEEKAILELYKLSLAGSQGFVNAEFSAQVIMRRCNIDKPQS